MKRVLIIAYYFPPIAASGSVRPAAFCRYLPELGWIPTVITADGSALDPPLSEDRSLCDGLPCDLTVVRVSHANPNQFLLRLRDWAYAVCGRRREAGSRSMADATGGGKHRIDRNAWRRWFDHILERVLIFPDPQKWWARPALRASEALIEAQRPDVILATGGPWTSLEIGKQLSERHGIPFVADFRDPWATNPYLTYGAPRLQLLAEKMEGAVCAQAAAIIANTEELGESFRLRYPELASRVVAITNGFDESLRCQPSVPAESLGDGPLVLAHFGTVYVKRSPLALFQALSRIASDQPALSRRLVVNFTGEWEIADPLCNQLASELEGQGILVRRPRIDRAECLARMAASQVLLVLQEGTPMQIPAKLYEYIAMQRPLLILGGVGATENVVRKHGLGVCCANEAGAIERLLRECLAGRLQFAVPAHAAVMNFDYRSLTARLAAVLCRVSGPPPAECERRAGVV